MQYSSTGHNVEQLIYTVNSYTYYKTNFMYTIWLICNEPNRDESPETAATRLLDESD